MAMLARPPWAHASAQALETPHGRELARRVMTYKVRLVIGRWLAEFALRAVGAMPATAALVPHTMAEAVITSDLPARR